MTPAEIKEAYDRLVAEYRTYKAEMRAHGYADIPSFEEYVNGSSRQAAEDRWRRLEAADKLDLY